jgi:hypothetical protein
MKGRLLAFEGRRNQAPKWLTAAPGVLGFEYDSDNGL